MNRKKERELRKNMSANNRQPQSPIRIDFDKAKQQECSCGHKLFEPGFELGVISAIMSPTGQELLAHRQVWVCKKCGEPKKS